MKLKISQLKLPIDHTKEDMQKAIAKALNISSSISLIQYKIIRKSLDARKKPNLYYVYAVVVDISDKTNNPFIKSIQSKKKDVSNIQIYNEIKYIIPKLNMEDSTMDGFNRPVIIGAGPAGLFCGYLLAKAGLKPIIIERGQDVESRIKDVEAFWNGKSLNTESNVQFGEGGAGTFSDGKLNTQVKDKDGRIQFVLETLVEHGGPESILYEQKPHIGTDILTLVVKNIRLSIEGFGGEVRFNSRLIDFETTVDKFHLKIARNSLKQPTNYHVMSTNYLILAIGHSARDTFEMLYSKGIPMRSKAFAVGVRIEHKQELINYSQYGTAKDVNKYVDLPSASYKLAEQLDNGRGVYSFCMCPGGYVVDASSEREHLAINGMSYSNRGSDNANSAIVVTVTPDDFNSDHPLSGVEYQRTLEEKAYKAGDGRIPIQRFQDYCNNQKSRELGEVRSCTKGNWQFGNLQDVFADEINQSIQDGIKRMDKKIEGFANPDAILSGVESRTSSPVRILRNENYESDVKGIYPCGEGAGYAGGIMSAAMDGLKVAEAIISQYEQGRQKSRPSTAMHT